jgi:predicted TIM-barrel fold metal-dependent hydrolase
MEQFIYRYGVNRLLFGSDFPFGFPADELHKVKKLGLTSDEYERVVFHNIMELIGIEKSHRS